MHYIYKLIPLIIITLLFSACSTQPKPVKTVTSLEKLMISQRTIIDENFNKQISKAKVNKEKIYLINRYISTFAYKSDIKNYGSRDYWATSEEFYKHKGGDCEDIAIAQYDLLIKYGIDKTKLDFLKCRTQQGLHIVLRYKIDENKYVILEHGFIIKYQEYTKNTFKGNTIYTYKKYKILKTVNNIFSYII